MEIHRVMKASIGYRATNLSERAQLLDRSTLSHLKCSGHGRAESLFQHWKSKRFASDEHFAQRLLQEGLSEDDLRRLLESDARGVIPPIELLPDWLDRVFDILSEGNTISM